MNNKNRNSERGSAGVKLLIFLVIVAIAGNAAINYVPVAYKGETVKQEMRDAVIRVVSMPSTGKTPADLVKEKINNMLKSNQIDGAYVDVKMLNTMVQARVYYKVEVPLLPFGLFKKTYEFDHTATPTGLLAQQ